MKKTWPQVIRDPVHDLIMFEDNECDRLLPNLINTREFQRLRRIKQLGLCDMVFPGANHSRFAHSIGVMQNARRFLDRVQRLFGRGITSRHRMLVATAALLHDIGHGPFSHAFEKVTGDSHEARTLEIIRDPSSEVHSRLKEIDGNLSSELACFFDEDIEEVQLQQANLPSFLTQIVSSQLDADRFDYLIRDSGATGTQYGKFDLGWMIQQLQVMKIDTPKTKKGKESNAAPGMRLKQRPIHGKFYLSSKALFAAEEYVFARFHMYRSVYFHKTTRAAEVMLRSAFQRFNEMLLRANTEEMKNAIVPGSSHIMIRAFSGAAKAISLNDYLSLDDFSVTEFLKGCAHSSDAWLKELGTGLIDRRLFKATDVSDAGVTDVDHFASAVREKIREKQLDTSYAFVDDTAADTPYKPYEPDAEKPATQIYVENSLGQIKELSSQTEAVDSLKKKYTLVRYYYPERIREIVDEIAKTTLRRGKA